MDEREPLLQAQGVHACYETVEVLHGVDLQIERGTVTTILGPNGAGKTTFLNVIAGLHPPSSGTVRFDGNPVRYGRGDALVRDGMCLIPEGRGVFPNLTVQENLLMMTHGGASRREVEAKAYSHFPPLSARRSQLAGTLSGGEQQMLSLARAVTIAPRLLLLDELSMGLAPMVVEHLYRVVGELASEDSAVVIVEQFAEFALGIAHSAVIMIGGGVAFAGSTSDAEKHLHHLYLGVEGDSATRP